MDQNHRLSELHQPFFTGSTGPCSIPGQDWPGVPAGSAGGRFLLQCAYAPAALHASISLHCPHPSMLHGYYNSILIASHQRLGGAKGGTLDGV